MKESEIIKIEIYDILLSLIRTITRIDQKIFRKIEYTKLIEINIK